MLYNTLEALYKFLDFDNIILSSICSCLLFCINICFVACAAALTKTELVIFYSVCLCFYVMAPFP